ncbi:MAG: hypothetical protein J6Z14_06190 [Prevotella sp.]|nr:hypothetical protein [Prevotella sp.]
MKKTLLTIAILAISILAATAQKRTARATLYREFKPSTILLNDGRVIKQPLTNVFLKNSSLVYLKGTYTMEANMDNIKAVSFDDRSYIVIDKQLAYQVGEKTDTDNALYRIDLFDMDAYQAQLRNNVNISNLDLGEMIGVTTVDLNNEEDYKFPIIPIYYMQYNGEMVKVHERELWRRLPKDKDLRRMFKTVIGENSFSWTNDSSLLVLLKAISPKQ